MRVVLWTLISVLVQHTGLLVHGFSCLTWTFRQNELQIIYKTENFSSPLYFYDNNGVEKAFCDFENVCNNQSIFVDVQTGTVVLRFKRVEGSKLSGNWSCKQGSHLYSTYVTENGDFDNSVQLLMKGEVYSQNNESFVNVECSSCREPYRNRVYYVLNDMYGDVIYKTSSNSCSSTTGICDGFSCSCSKWPIFRKTYPKDDYNEMIFTCSMRFHQRSKYIDKTSRLSFDGNKSFTLLEPTHQKGSGTRYTTTINILETPETSGENLSLWIAGPVGILVIICVVIIITCLMCRMSKKKKPNTYDDIEIPLTQYLNTDRCILIKCCLDDLVSPPLRLYIKYFVSELYKLSKENIKCCGVLSNQDKEKQQNNEVDFAKIFLQTKKLSFNQLDECSIESLLEVVCKIKEFPDDLREHALKLKVLVLKPCKSTEIGEEEYKMAMETMKQFLLYLKPNNTNLKHAFLLIDKYGNKALDEIRSDSAECASGIEQAVDMGEFRKAVANYAVGELKVWEDEWNTILNKQLEIDEMEKQIHEIQKIVDDMKKKEAMYDYTEKGIFYLIKKSHDKEGTKESYLEDCESLRQKRTDLQNRFVWQYIPDLEKQTLFVSTLKSKMETLDQWNTKIDKICSVRCDNTTESLETKLKSLENVAREFSKIKKLVSGIERDIGTICETWKVASSGKESLNKKFQHEKQDYNKVRSRVNGTIENIKESLQNHDRYAQVVTTATNMMKGTTYQATEKTKDSVHTICEDKGIGVHEYDISLTTIKNRVATEIEGTLQRKVSIRNGFKDKWFVVKKEGILKQYESRPNTKQSPQWKMNIILADFKLEKDGLRFKVTSTEGHTVKLKAKSTEERQKWVSTFESISKHYFPPSFQSYTLEGEGPVESQPTEPEKPARSRFSFIDTFKQRDVFPEKAKPGTMDLFFYTSDLEKQDASKVSAEDIRKMFKEMTIVSKRKSYSLVAAIDFGSFHSGCAFSFKSDFIKDPLKAHVMSLGKSALESLKEPTVLLLNPEQEFVAFGKEAEERFAGLVQDDPDKAKHWYYFSNFKMQLYKNKDLRKEIMLKDITGKKEMKAVDVFAYCIEYIKDKMFRRVQDQYLELQEEDVHWVLTVPAIWDEAARQFMIDAANKAGIDTERLTLAYEPEAAALYCKHLELQQDNKEREKASLQSFQTGARFLVVDLGGGTVDITSNEVLESGQLKEIHSACGGPWGGNSINAEIWRFFENVFGKSAIDNFIKEEKDDYLHLSQAMEVKKRNLLGDTITFEIPFSLLWKAKKEFPNGISYVYPDDVQLINNKLKVKSFIIKDIFEEEIRTIISHVERLLRKPELAGVSTLLLVGGYASSDLLKHTMINKFMKPNLKVMCPLESEVVVLKGAVIMGHMDTPIVGRIAKVHYGIAINADFHKINSQDRSFKTRISRKQEFYTIIRKGQLIRVNEVVSVFNFPITLTKDEAIIYIYASDDDEPPTRITKDNCQKIGIIRVKLPRGRRATQLKIGISNNQTEFKVVARDELTGKCFKGVCRFLDE